jgi:hypothetical protein
VREAFDLGVTLLKMSEKRAFVDSVLRATATSGLFTQDVVEEAVEDTAPVSSSYGPSVAGRAAGEPTVHVTRDAPSITADAEVAASYPDNASPHYHKINDSPTIEHVLAVTGGELVEPQPETVEVGPSSVPNVERGGRTAGANDAQVAEVRRLLGELNWGAKAGLGYALNTLEIEGEVPDDGRIARSQFSSLLDSLGSTSIGLLIQKLSNEVELDNAARPVTVTP